MALYPPPAIRKLIPPGDNDPRIKVVGVVLHVRDGLGDSLYDYFNGPSGGVESHSYTRFTGVEEQYRDTGWEADANLDGNSFWRGSVLCGFASIETEGLAAGKWTDAQIVSIKRRLIWYRDVHGVPLKVATAWNGDGVGYHTMWGSPSHWTPVAKSCPGPERIQQFHTILVPWMEAGAPPPDEPWPAFRETSDAVTAMVKKLEYAGYFHTGHRDRPGYYGAWTRGAVKNLQESYADTKTDPDGLIGPLTWAHIQALPDAPPPPGRQWRWPVVHELKNSVGVQGSLGAIDDTLALTEALIAGHPKWRFGPAARVKIQTARDTLSEVWHDLNAVDKPL